MLGTVGSWLMRFGSLVTAMVEVSLPRKPSYHIFRHLVPLLVVFEVLLIVAGALTGVGPLLTTGIAALLVTLATALLVGLLTDVLSGRRKLRGLLVVVVILVAVAILALAVVGIVDLAT